MRKTVFINPLPLDVKKCEKMKIYLNIRGKVKIKVKVKVNLKLPHYRPGEFLRAPGG